MNTINVNNQKKYQNTQSERRKKQSQSTLEGVLINNYKEDKFNINETCDSLIIPKAPTLPHVNNKENKKENSFNFKKATMPLLIGTLAIFAGTVGLSLITKKSAKYVMKTPINEQLPDLARNMNIREEPQFAMYELLRNPNTKNALGLAGVGIFSGMTLVAKSFVDGIKKVWEKKREADIERDLQENLIEVETKSFSGKLQEVRNILSERANYFKKILNKNGDVKIQNAPEDIFSAFKGKSSKIDTMIAFKGAEETQPKKEKNSKQGLIYTALAGATLLFGVLAGRATFKNFRETAKIANDFTNDFTGKVLDNVENLVKEDAGKNIDKIKTLLQSIYAKPSAAKEILENSNLDKGEIDKVVDEIEKGAKAIYADAPTALGGIPQKLQYYCYMNEDRGHLYNWIIHPENKFTKYIFLAFSAITALGYTGKQAIEALQHVSVAKENSKTELDLAQRLVEVEIANFKAKKESAVEPLMDEFNLSLQEGKSPEGLKNMAENILLEIKNGPPFVYS